MSDKATKKSLEYNQKKQIKSALSYAKKLVSRTKPGNISEEQANELKKAANELRQAAKGII